LLNASWCVGQYGGTAACHWAVGSPAECAQVRPRQVLPTARTPPTQSHTARYPTSHATTCRPAPALTWLRTELNLPPAAPAFAFSDLAEPPSTPHLPPSLEPRSPAPPAARAPSPSGLQLQRQSHSPACPGPRAVPPYR